MQNALVRGAVPADAARYALAARLPGPDTGARLRPVASAVSPVSSQENAEDGRPLVAHSDGSGEIGARVRVGGRVLRLPGAGRRARGLGRAALALDATAARTLLAESIAIDGVDATWDSVARPVLRAIADRWCHSGAGVEIEHLLSECVIGAFATYIAAAAPPMPDVRPVLLAGMPGEQHMLPMVVLAAALADRQVQCRPLGANLPYDALVAAIRRTAPVAVVLWSQLSETADPDLLRRLPRTRPLFRTFVAGPGWGGVVLPLRVVELESLAGAADVLAAASA